MLVSGYAGVVRVRCSVNEYVFPNTEHRVIHALNAHVARAWTKVGTQGSSQDILEPEQVIASFRELLADFWRSERSQLDPNGLFSLTKRTLDGIEYGIVESSIEPNADHLVHRRVRSHIRGKTRADLTQKGIAHTL